MAQDIKEREKIQLYSKGKKFISGGTTLLHKPLKNWKGSLDCFPKPKK